MKMIRWVLLLCNTMLSETLSYFVTSVSTTDFYFVRWTSGSFLLLFLLSSLSHQNFTTRHTKRVLTSTCKPLVFDLLFAFAATKTIRAEDEVAAQGCWPLDFARAYLRQTVVMRTAFFMEFAV